MTDGCLGGNVLRSSGCSVVEYPALLCGLWGDLAGFSPERTFQPAKFYVDVSIQSPNLIQKSFAHCFVFFFQAERQC